MPNGPPTCVDPPSLRAIRTSLIVLAVRASAFMLRWVGAVRMPLTLGLMLSMGGAASDAPRLKVRSASRICAARCNDRARSGNGAESKRADSTHNLYMPVNDPSSDSAARPGTGALDPEVLRQLRALDPLGHAHLFERLAAAFELLLQRLMPGLDSALQSTDLTAVAPLAHTLKSAAAALGAKALAADCAAIESMLRHGRQDGRYDDLYARVQSLRNDLPKVRVAVQALINADPRVAASPVH